MKDDKAEVTHLESHALPGDNDVVFEQEEVAVMGTVRLTDGDIVYVPTPSADPQDPLNMTTWHKYAVIIIISIFSTLGLALVSGFGGLLGFYIPEYAAVGKDYADITHLMTYPTLFMGIGNLIGMPIAYAVGRRIVFLFSTVIVIVGAILCAKAQNYEWHLGARMLLGLAAGQSEALVPMITQEIFFLHERSRGLMIQQTVQVILTAVVVLFAGPIAEAITPQGWYGLGAGLAGLQLILSIFLLPETKYYRPASAFQESSGSDEDGKPQRSTQRVELDLVNYAPRTWRSDMRLWVGEPEWKKGWDTFRQTFELILFPNVFWALCLNGVTLGCNIAIGTTYGTIVTGAPYNWPQSSASYVNCGQIITALVALPFFGHGSDKIIRWFADRRGGLHEPETRIIPLIFPIVIGIITAVLYGLGAENPEKFHWFVYVWGVAAYYFAFVGANIVAITYLLDSYPARAGPMLIVICAFRGIISFGVSYGISPFIESHGYAATFSTFGGLTGAFGLLGVPVYFYGKRIRQYTGKFSKDKSD
ncbi:hypothetical protein PFICI_08758 [Pestalotiopsis fici W106-1]|uniref:Major facilitator superfamily (MFS) profile domain-containing protein n=1 Tax=Pestalotiopsis fici (strain W106-1 / CGMCC3.15140) TaxID=1229662 RepID=W3WYI2_PESFW|nr:uncharacterized protein PFICI_08758 [Pestalotiopsis fici W106-1]ETS78905.1 hypothetical protein PFICI_08758 [Pestalotiopsis fici W106-1]